MHYRIPTHSLTRWPNSPRECARLARTDLKFVETLLLIGCGENDAELDSLARIQHAASAKLMEVQGL